MLVDLYRYRGLLIIIAVLVVLVAVTMGIRHARQTEPPSSENEPEPPYFHGELLSWDEVDELFPKFQRPDNRCGHRLLLGSVVPALNMPMFSR